MMEKKRMLLLDGNSIINRAFYGIRILTTKDGTFTNGVYGFLNILLKYKEELSPDYILATFDLKAPTFRHELFEGYKATRKGMPEELVPQLPLLKEVLSAMNIRILEKEGYEADDLIGTVSKLCDEQGIECVVLSGDKDDLQLATDNTKIYLVTTRMGRTDTEIFNHDKVVEKYGVTPDEFIDVKALMGDKSDNIPGVTGIGEKGAFSLVQEFKTLENIYENIESESITKSLRNKLTEGKDMAFFSRTLATIDKNVPIAFSLDEAMVKEYDLPTLTELFTRLEFKTFLKKLPSVPQGVKPTQQFADGTYQELTDISEIQEKLSSVSGTVYYLLYPHTKTITFAADDKACYAVKLSDQTTPLFQAFFEDESISKVTHNLRDDIVFLHGYDIKVKGVEFDTAIGAYLLSPSRKDYEISEVYFDFLGVRLGNSGDVENEQLTFESVEVEADFVSQARYTTALISLLAYEQEELKRQGQFDLFTQIEMPLVYVLADMQVTGFQIDKAKLSEFGQILTAQINSLTQEIYDFAGGPFNINSPKQLGVVLFEDLKLPAVKKTKTGYSTNVEVLEKLADKHPIIGKIMEYRQISKLSSTYVEGLLNVISPVTGKIHSSFNQTVAVTGRISSTEPNLQNIPVRTELGREMRKMFVASDEHYVLVDADYSQIELRVLAHIADDQNMIEAFQCGLDFHSNTAAKIFHVKPEEVTTYMRSASKAINFGLVYGMGEFSLSQDLKISLKEAKEYMNQYLGSYPNVQKYMKEIVETAKQNGYVTTMFGRRRDIPEINSSNFQLRSFGERVALNTPIQGSAADIIKLAMVHVYQKLKELGLKSRLILQVHDELIIEAHKDELDTVKELLKNEMEHVCSLKVPLKVDMNVGKSWYDTK